MLYYALASFVIALVADVLGFTGIAAGAVETARILFFLYLALAALSFVIGTLTLSMGWHRARLKR